MFVCGCFELIGVTAASLCWSLSVAHHVRVGVGEPGLGYPPHHVKLPGGGTNSASVHVMSQVGLVGNQRWGKSMYVVVH